MPLEHILYVPLHEIISNVPMFLGLSSYSFQTYCYTIEPFSNLDMLSLGSNDYDFQLGL